MYLFRPSVIFVMFCLYIPAPRSIIAQFPALADPRDHTHC